MVRYEVTARWRVESGRWQPYSAQVQSTSRSAPTPRAAERAIRQDVGVALGVLPRAVRVRDVGVRPIDQVSLLTALRPDVRPRSGGARKARVPTTPGDAPPAGSR